MTRIAGFLLFFAGALPAQAPAGEDFSPDTPNGATEARASTAGRIVGPDRAAVHDATAQTDDAGRVPLLPDLKPGTYVVRLRFAGDATVAPSRTAFLWEVP